MFQFQSVVTVIHRPKARLKIVRSLKTRVKTAPIRPQSQPITTCELSRILSFGMKGQDEPSSCIWCISSEEGMNHSGKGFIGSSNAL